MSIWDEFHALPQESQVDIISRIRKSYRNEIHSYENEIQRVTKEHHDYLDQLKRQNADKDLFSIAKKGHASAIADIQTEMDDLLELEKHFAKNPIETLKQEKLERELRHHGREYFKPTASDLKQSQAETFSDESIKTVAQNEPLKQAENIQEAAEKHAKKPPVNRTKVEQTTKTVKEKTEARNTETKTPPPSQPDSTPGKTPKVETPTAPHGPTFKTDVPDVKGVSTFLKANNSKIILGAIGVGVARAAIDKEDDNLLSTAGKGAVTGAVAAGISYGAQILAKENTVQDLVRGEVADTADYVLKRAKAEDRMMKIGTKVPKTLGIGALVLGAATVIDIGQRIGDHLESKSMEAEQEWDMKQRVRAQKKKQKEQSYGYINNGEIVLDLFEARTGHYKMGNARFQ